jgi:hypothetical protein
MRPQDPTVSNRRILLLLVLVGAVLFFGSIFFVVSRAH